MKYQVLQCGFQKSGNYFLWKLLRMCQEYKGVFSSYMVSTGLSELFKYLYSIRELDPKFDRYFEVDEVIIERDGIFIYKDYPNEDRRIKLKINPEILMSYSSIIWTHSKAEDAVDLASYVPFRFYLLRDGRDVVNSYIHFNCSPVMRKLNPDYKISDPAVLYSRLDVFKSYVLRWKEHVENYLRYKDFFIELRFEKLVNFGDDFLKVIRLFELEEKVEELKKELGFDSMVKKNKNHLRKGKQGDWRNFFREEHIKIFKEIAGEILVVLGYEKDLNW